MTAAQPSNEHIRRHMMIAIPVGLISAVLTLTGGYFKDRIGMESTTTASTVRIENLERRQDDVERILRSLPTQEQLSMDVDGLNRRLDDVLRALDRDRKR